MKQADLQLNILWLRICIVAFVIAILGLVVFSTASSKAAPGELKENAAGKNQSKENANVQYVQSFIII